MTDLLTISRYMTYVACDLLGKYDQKLAIMKSNCIMTTYIKFANMTEKKSIK